MRSNFDTIKFDEHTSEPTANKFKRFFMEVEVLMHSRLLAGRSREMALAHLEEALMWINKAIRDDQWGREDGARTASER